MKRSVNPSPIQLILGLFRRLFARLFPKSAKPGNQTHWDKTDAMVGTVRSEEQLAFNLFHNCYYVPGRFLPQEKLPIRYIALHEWDHEDIPCILRIGEVSTTETLPRGSIPVTMRPGADPNEPYYFFTVKEWANLPYRIEIRDTARGKPLFTTRFLLEHCRVSWELFAVADSKDYALLKAIYGLLGGSEGTTKSYSISSNRTVIRENGNLMVINRKKKPLGAISLKAYKASPRNSFLYLKKLLQ